jgi:hypothetical protein
VNFQNGATENTSREKVPVGVQVFGLLKPVRKGVGKNKVFGTVEKATLYRGPDAGQSADHGVDAILRRVIDEKDLPETLARRPQ